MGIVEEPIISKLDRLDIIMKQLEDIRGEYVNHSPKSSSASTESALSATGWQIPSSSDFSPKSFEANFRPLDDAIVEAQMKGTLMGRLLLLEQRLIKLCLQLEEEVEAEKKKEKTKTEKSSSSSSSSPSSTTTRKGKGKGKGLKGLVRSYIKLGVGGGTKHIYSRRTPPSP